ncbi:hypothetical protein Pcinc_024829 [Petrolisthes cinctipes]|uniref:Uncharacterized protein n=1 Tax=Petrolisthes cinctipes TaxID=88211 RepID=A0AAE1KAA5_PETCI|nr:hypothetical protein Pcinc_024829 [Petrolisthes cinctipes]
MRGANCSTDHRLIRSKLRLVIRPYNPRATTSKKLNTNALKDPELTMQLRRKLASELTAIPESNDVQKTWEDLQDTIHQAPVDTIRTTTSLPYLRQNLRLPYWSKPPYAVASTSSTLTSSSSPWSSVVIDYDGLP